MQQGKQLRDGQRPADLTTASVPVNGKGNAPVQAWSRTPTKRSLIDVGSTPDTGGSRRLSTTTRGPSTRARWVTLGRPPSERRQHVRTDRRSHTGTRAGETSRPTVQYTTTSPPSRDESATPNVKTAPQASPATGSCPRKPPVSVKAEVTIDDAGHYSRLLQSRSQSTASLRAAQTVAEAKLCWMLRWGKRTRTNYCDDAMTRRILVWLAEVEKARACAIVENDKVRLARRDIVTELV